MLLLVDDNLEQLELLQLILERQGFTVATAATATDAIGRCHQGDTVVMDLRIPALDDGLSLIRQLSACLGVSIVVLAGFPEELTGRPERALVHHILRKGGGTGALVDLLRSADRPPSTP